MPRPYALLDVFTNTPFTGNPLAVVSDAADLTETQMQAIAKEFNLSETVFITKPLDAQNHAAIRIFTPVYEMPFAGHPIIGTACYFAKLNEQEENQQPITLHVPLGSVPCEITRDACGSIAARLTAPQSPKKLPCTVSYSAIAAALDISIDDIGFDNFTPTQFDSGVPYTCVPLKSRAALAKAKPILAHWTDAFGTHSHNDAYVFTNETDDPASDYSVRMFAPHGGSMEDPATGSAAVAFAGVLAEQGPPNKMLQSFLLEQGNDMGRPSHIQLGFCVVDNTARDVTIGGYSVLLIKGTLYQ